MQKETLRPAAALKSGVYKEADGLTIAVSFPVIKDCGIELISTKTKKTKRIHLTDDCRTGHLFHAILTGIDTSLYDGYRLFCDGKAYADPLARHIIGLERFGVNPAPEELIASLDDPVFDFTEDVAPGTPLKDSFLYLLHPRGFTMNANSGVRKEYRGTFRGVLEKLDHLKALHVTAVELMPAYEMNVVTVDEGPMLSPIARNGRVMKDEKGGVKVNYWGYKEGFYFAPRAAYCYDKNDPCGEFAYLVKTLHQNGIEVIMQFYFPNWIASAHILDVLRFWVQTYHIDGVHVKGERIPKMLIASDPMLQDCKIFHDTFDFASLSLPTEAPVTAQIAEYRNDFKITAARFLKGDDSTLAYFVSQMNHLYEKGGVINYVGNYDGFTLMDLVSFERKHNEANGENNMDGEDRNFSWNCGVEGKTRRKAVNELRKRQIKNILTMLFFAQGTPLLHAGDEFGNSQDGNNNPYCQDNATGWLDWSALKKNPDIFAYVQWLRDFTMRFSPLHTGKPFSLLDAASTGYPDLSYHGIEAWRPDMTNYSHAVGMLYGASPEKEKDAFLYVAFNMHWADIKLALPTLPEKMQYQLLVDTSREEPVLTEPESCTGDAVKSPSRSVQILAGVRSDTSSKDNKKRRQLPA